MRLKKKVKTPEPDALFLTSDQVAQMILVSVRTLWRMVKKDQFPQPVRYNRKLVRWRVEDVRTYIDSLTTVKPSTLPMTQE